MAQTSAVSTPNTVSYSELCARLPRAHGICELRQHPLWRCACAEAWLYSFFATVSNSATDN